MEKPRDIEEPKIEKPKGTKLRNWETDATYLILRLAEAFPDLTVHSSKGRAQEVLEFLKKELDKAPSLKSLFTGGKD